MCPDRVTCPYTSMTCLGGMTCLCRLCSDAMICPNPRTYLLFYPGKWHVLQFTMKIQYIMN